MTSNADSPGLYPRFQIGTVSVDEPRPMKVVCIGAGFSGIMTGARYLKEVPNVELTIYEKEAGVGGVWYNNKYPGVACDIPSHSYQIPFENNTQWSSFYAPGEEIRGYIQGMVKRHDLTQHIRLGHELLSAQWDPIAAKWRLHIRLADSADEMDDDADVLVVCTGILNRWSWPNIDGLGEFRGTVVHSAQREAWEQGTEDWADKTIGVIGAGSSAIQIVPALQPKVKRVINYVRSPTWVCAPWGPPRLNELVNRDGNDEEYIFTDEDREKFKDEKYYRWFRHELEMEMTSAHHLMSPDSEMQKSAKEFFKTDMRNKLAKKPWIAEYLIPEFAVGCRRLTPGPGYLKALCEDNVDFVRSDIKHITPTGIETVDGQHRDVDVIVCATGFDTSFQWPFTILGRNSTTIQEKFSPHPVTYLGVCVDGFPNMFIVGGPNASQTTASFLTFLDRQAMYSVQATLKLQRERLRSIEVKREAVEDFDEYLETYFPTTVHAQHCPTWFKRGANGKRVVCLWPGSGLHGIRALTHPRWEDFDYERMNGIRNRMHWLGDGQTYAEKTMEGDRAWYLKEYM
ncbi:FAD/NAD(P)-binding domain-containing protein [Artomyces pyxidatus]|uniref:FAD/NAD(P)-binding domain-containing protein n=1 Tax=Artomyces pyxidatus TaxID=48021 RepID=A0ACB8SXN0_9AGAM|nr:FAD/NAD(P)-binding domain-containing protein [Artomyces pyxidatus]